MKFTDSVNFVTLEAGLVHQLLDLRARVKVDVAASRVQSHFSHGRTPRPESRKRHDRFVFRKLSHLFQHGQRIADVIEQSDTEADVKLLLPLVGQQVGLLKLTNLVEVLFLARLFAQSDHHFRDVDSYNFSCALACELETVKTVAAAYVEECPVFDRLTMLDGENVTLVHVFPKDAVEHV